MSEELAPVNDVITLVAIWFKQPSAIIKVVLPTVEKISDPEEPKEAAQRVTGVCALVAFSGFTEASESKSYDIAVPPEPLA
jgi:hypothetical protein